MGKGSPILAQPTVTLALCQGAVAAAEEALAEFGGKDLLGYALSHRHVVDDGREGLLAYADAIRNLVAAQRQLVEAQRIAKWNASPDLKVVARG